MSQLLRHMLLLIPLVTSFTFAGTAMPQDKPAVPKFEVIHVRFRELVSRSAAAFSPDGTLLAIGHSQGSLRLIRVRDAKVIRTITAHRFGVSRIAFTPDGKTLVTAGWAGDGAYRLWEVASGTKRLDLEGYPNGATVMAMSPNGRWLVGGLGSELRIYDLTTGRVQHTLKAPATVDSVSFSPDAQFFASSNGNYTVSLWETTTGKSTANWPVPELINMTGCQVVAFSPDGQTLATGSKGGNISLWNAASRKLQRQIEIPNAFPTQIVWSPQGPTIVVSDGNEVALWDAATGKKLVGWSEQAPFAVACSPKGNAFAWGTAQGLTLVRGDLNGFFEKTSALPAKAASAIKVPARKIVLPAERIADHWERLRGADAEKAYASIHELIAADAQAVAYLGERVQPAPAANNKWIGALVADLNDPGYEVRRAAVAELLRIGDQIDVPLREALTKPKSLEQRRRIEEVLDHLDRTNSSGESLRTFRAIEVLEHIATPEAKQVLESFAKGAPGARVTIEAKAALQRLAR